MEGGRNGRERGQFDAILTGKVHWGVPTKTTSLLLVVAWNMSNAVQQMFTKHM